MEALFQIGKELAELKNRVEALEQNASASNQLLAKHSLQAPTLEPAPNEGTLTPSGIVHRVPSVPIFVDGVFLEKPQEIEKYNDKPLYYTPLRGSSEIALIAFTNRNAMILESKRMVNTLAAEKRAASEHVCTSNPDSLSEQVCFFGDINESGDILCLSPGRAYPDLTRVSRGFLGSSNWNDFISSITWCRWDVSLFEHSHYRGSELWLPAGCNTPNLVQLSWNDRASAVVNWGRRFGS